MNTLMSKELLTDWDFSVKLYSYSESIMKNVIFAEYDGMGGSFDKLFEPTGRWKIKEGLLHLEHRGFLGMTTWFNENCLHFIPEEPIINTCHRS
jgi:hypothetical protein